MVRIRLARTGAKKKPSYRVAVADKRDPRNGRCIEYIGHYNPMVEPPVIVIDLARGSSSGRAAAVAEVAGAEHQSRGDTLGQIGDRRDVPTLSRVATDINYRAHVPALTEPWPRRLDDAAVLRGLAKAKAPWREPKLLCEQRDLFEREFVEPAPLGPRRGAEGVEIVAAEILHHDHALRGVVEKNFRDAHADTREETRDVRVARVVRSLESVAHEDA